MSAPERTCVGCRTTRPAIDLVRIVRRDQGKLRPAESSAGRGAWLCRGSDSCVELAVRRRAFGRAFRSEVSNAAVADLVAHLAEEVSRTP